MFCFKKLIFNRGKAAERDKLNSQKVLVFCCQRNGQLLEWKLHLLPWGLNGEETAVILGANRIQLLSAQAYCTYVGTELPHAMNSFLP